MGVAPAAGGVPPVERDIVRHIATTADARSELRSVERFFRALEPAPGADADAPARFESSVRTALSDRLYATVLEPESPAKVRVVLAVRSRCANLVLIESVSIET